MIIVCYKLLEATFSQLYYHNKHIVCGHRGRMLFLHSYFSEFSLRLVTKRSCDDTKTKQAGAELGHTQIPISWCKCSEYVKSDRVYWYGFMSGTS